MRRRPYVDPEFRYDRDVRRGSDACDICGNELGRESWAVLIGNNKSGPCCSATCCC